MDLTEFKTKTNTGWSTVQTTWNEERRSHGIYPEPTAEYDVSF